MTNKPSQYGTKHLLQPSVANLEALEEQLNGSSTIPETSKPANDEEVSASLTTGIRARVGRVVSVSRSKAVVLMDLDQDKNINIPIRVGQLLCLGSKTNDIVARISAVNAPTPRFEEQDQQILITEIDLIGEFIVDDNGAQKFKKGLSSFPMVGDVATTLLRDDITKIFQTSNKKLCRIGVLNDGQGVPAMISPEKLIESNFMVVGSDGAGKSSAIASLIRSQIKNNFSSRVIIFDQYGEYTRSFGKMAHVVDLRHGGLAHWMLSMPELINLLEAFGGDLTKDEKELLGEAVQSARKLSTQRTPSILAKAGTKGAAKITSETPLPYRMTDVISYLDKLVNTDTRFSGVSFIRLRSRLYNITHDKTYAPIFGALSTQDSLADLISTVFRFPDQGKTVTLLQYDGLIAPIAHVIVSAFCRIAKMIIEAGIIKDPILIIVEDADDYLQADQNRYRISNKAIEDLLRISRKRNIGLGMVTAHPRSIDPVIYDQCGTLLSLNLKSAKDQDYIEEVSPDSSVSVADIVGILGQGEAIALGYAVTLPSRFRFDALPRQAIPTRFDQNPPLVNGVPTQSDQAMAAWLVNNWRFNTEEGNIEQMQTIRP
ncbi:MAG: ATP-binding protein [bacterium]